MSDAGNIVLIRGKAVDPESGLLADAPGFATNWEPAELGAGSTVAPLPGGPTICVHCYTKGFDESLAHVYTYDAESNWTTLQPDLGSTGWLAAEDGAWVAPCDCFVRVTAQLDGGRLGQASYLSDVAAIAAAPTQLPPIPEHFQAEIDRVCVRVQGLREPGDLVLIVLSDIHYSVGCIWPETARNIREVAARIAPDAIVQLGDVSDGIAPVRVTRSFVNRVLGDLRACGVPVLGCVGNHDANYFKGNAERLTALECAQLYIGRDELWYAHDFPQAKVRCLFLKSFEPEREERYGFETEQVRWLEQALRETPDGWQVVVFSHLPLYADIHYWSETLLNEGKITRALGRFNRHRKGALAGFVHGHSHVDQVFWRQSFPDVSIGCAKLEDFEECKPAGSVTPVRTMGTASQDLWDVLVLKAGGHRMELVRFGAGEDRSVGTYRAGYSDREAIRAARAAKIAGVGAAGKRFGSRLRGHLRKRFGSRLRGRIKGWLSR